MEWCKATLAVCSQGISIRKGVLNLEFVLGSSFPASSVCCCDGVAALERSRAETYHLI
jgi:hypothetical protein